MSLHSSEGHGQSHFPAAQANREFSAVLRRVRRGQSFAGQPLRMGGRSRKFVPVSEGEAVGRSAAAALFSRLEAGRAQSIGRWQRSELYEDES